MGKKGVIVIRLIKAITIIAFCFMASSCATVLTVGDLEFHQENHLVYSGTRLDGETFIRPFYPHGQLDAWYWMPLAAIDMPFSFVADTVIFPVTIWTYSE